MDAVFLRVLSMSLTASYVILFVLAARLLLKRAPKIFSYALWGIVLFRLVCPFSFEGAWSLLPDQARTAVPAVDFGGKVSFLSSVDAAYHAIGDAVNGGLGTVTVYLGSTPDGYPIVTGAYHWQVWLIFGRYLWLAGIAVMLIYSAVSLLRLRARLMGAVKWRDNIYLADSIGSPFVLGVLRPKIYLPSGISEREREYILLHEQTHIRRLDPAVKIAGFLALAVHWFNPLVWAAFFLCAKDMEMSCDEAVMKRMNKDIRREYSASLLSLATGRSFASGVPLAFGEGDTRSRIKNVLNYKKPAFWMGAASLAVCAVLAVCLTANPRTGSLEWRPQPEYENQDDYFEALGKANEADRTGEITAEDMGDRDQTARDWMESWFDMYQGLPEDNMARITEGAVDRLEIVKVSKEGLPEGFVFSVTFSVRPTYPIGRNSFWMAGNTGSSPGRDETWGQMYREVELRRGDDGKYHFAEMGTGAVGRLDVYDLVGEDGAE